MYTPSAFAVTDPAKITQVISAHGFGLLINSGDGSPFASHLPFLHHPECGPSGTLLSHMARANRHWQLFRESEEALVIFNGPHAYISPSYYVAEAAVPTWNYVTVHVYGKARLMATQAELRQVLDETVAKYESARPEPWSAAKLPAEMETKLHQMIVGFEIEITRIEGKFKLGQNRSREDREKMLHALQASSDTDSQQLARFVEQSLAD